MYEVRTPGYSKRDAAKRWALPDRVFFACGACHVLAHACLEAHGTSGREAIWIRPPEGVPANHVVVRAADGWNFDFHGYSRRSAFFDHFARRARQRWPEWRGTLVPLPAEVLLSAPAARAFDPALRLREPGEFLHDALPRARRFLARFPLPPCRG